MKIKSLFEAFFLTIFIFTLLGGIYIIGSAWFHPETLGMQLTHLTPWIREDTFGIICWTTAFITFFIWKALRLSRLK